MVAGVKADPLNPSTTVLVKLGSALERIASPARPDGSYNLGRAAVGEMAHELLDGAGRYQPRSAPHNKETTRTEEP